SHRPGQTGKEGHGRGGQVTVKGNPCGRCYRGASRRRAGAGRRPGRKRSEYLWSWTVQRVVRPLRAYKVSPLRAPVTRTKWPSKYARSEGSEAIRSRLYVPASQRYWA